MRQHLWEAGRMRFFLIRYGKNRVRMLIPLKGEHWRDEMHPQSCSHPSQDEP
jgi:hypothetical protein